MKIAVAEDERLTQLQRAVRPVARARQELAEAERECRIRAALHVRAGVPKNKAADALGISRPTLDAWLRTVESTPAELVDLEEAERSEQRWLAKLAEQVAAGKTS